MDSSKKSAKEIVESMMPDPRAPYQCDLCGDIMQFKEAVEQFDNEFVEVFECMNCHNQEGWIYGGKKE